MLLLQLLVAISNDTLKFNMVTDHEHTHFLMENILCILTTTNMAILRNLEVTSNSHQILEVMHSTESVYIIIYTGLYNRQALAGW
jgi:hypothetical protein